MYATISMENFNGDRTTAVVTKLATVDTELHLPITAMSSIFKQTWALMSG